MDASRGRATCLRGGVKRLEVTELLLRPIISPYTPVRHLMRAHRAQDMAEVPDLLQNGAVATTAKVGNRPGLRLQSVLDLG